MELNRAGAELRNVEPLDRAVVQRHVRRFARLARLHREAVVLARDQDAAGGALEYGVVRAPVPELQLERALARCPRQQLVAEANAQDRDPPEQVAHGCDLVFERFWVARSVREQDTVVAE